MLTLLGLGIFCILGNLGFTLDRSLILRGLDAQVEGKEIGHEKHPGVDDVHWLRFKNGRRVHVDQGLWSRVEEGDHLVKEAWSSRLMLGTNAITLETSDDFSGMMPVMGGVAVVLILLTILSMQKIE